MDRPGMKRLRQAVQAGLVDCVVSYRFDRISRNLVDTVTLVRQEWAGKCIYRSATEGFDTSQDSPTGGLIFNILASFAEFERAVIRDRTRAGSLRRMKVPRSIPGGVGKYELQGEPLAKVEDAVPAIISKELFERVTSALAQRKGARPRGTNRANPDSLLTSIGSCKCGGPLGGRKGPLR